MLTPAALSFRAGLGAIPDANTIQSILQLTSAYPKTTLSPSEVSKPAKGFRLDPTFPPVPSKLVEKIQSLQFVKMKELLPDNVGLLCHMDTLDNSGVLASLPSYARPHLCEINSILS